MLEAEDSPILNSNLTAVEAISAKLAEVTRLAEKLDARLCEAGAKTRPISVPIATSSTSSLFSISAMPLSSAPMHAASNTAVLSSDMAVSDLPVITQMHPIISETVTTKIKSDVIKSVTPMTGKVDENSHHIHPHSIENVESWNKDFNANNKELIEKPRSESATGEYNAEGYTTATECSITPPPRSRSESFVTSPECEDIAIIATVVTCSDSTRWTTEKPKLTTTIASLTSTPNNENQKYAETTSNISIIGGIKPTSRIETMEKITNEKSNRIVKEVTETTVLRVSHDIRLGVASYKVISNTTQDHRHNIDVKAIQNVERVMEAEPDEKTDDIYPDLSSFNESKYYIDKKVYSDQNISKKLMKIQEHMLNESTRSDSREYEDASLPSQDLLRRHEDNRIEISSMKKDDNLEGEDFFERARKL